MGVFLLPHTVDCRYRHRQKSLDDAINRRINQPFKTHLYSVVCRQRIPCLSGTRVGVRCTLPTNCLYERLSLSDCVDNKSH